MAGARLFVYGTLLDDERVVAVTGRRFASRPARLDGWRRVLPRRGYPYLVPDAGAGVDGRVLEGLDDAGLAALDRYEDAGRLYHRRRVVVHVDGDALECEVYVGDVAALRAAGLDA
jgi:gamma-glutamylcyclotransferase (GGCT)/AIG2-like uncharacterized protein YtfP